MTRSACLADVATVVRGVTYSRDAARSTHAEGHLPILRAGNIQEDLLLDSDLIWVPRALVSNAQLLRQDDLVMCTSSGSAAVVGKTAVHKRSDWVGSFGAFCAVVRPDNSRCVPAFLKHVLSSHAFLRWARSSLGANIKNIRKSELEQFQFQLPSRADQQRVATILDNADSLRRKRQQVIRLANELLRAVFIDMFGDPVTNPRRWELRPFAELGALERGVSKHRPRNDPTLLGGRYPLIQTGDVANCDGYIRSYTSTYSEAGIAQSKLWPAGTLCITIAANIAKTGILTFPACFPDSVVGFSSSEPATVEFARFWLSFLQKKLEADAPESAQKNINLAILRGLQVPVPPVRLIRQFATVVRATEAIRTSQTQSYREVCALSRSLRHQLLDQAQNVVTT